MQMTHPVRFKLTDWCLFPTVAGAAAAEGDAGALQPSHQHGSETALKPSTQTPDAHSLLSEILG